MNNSQIDRQIKSLQSKKHTNTIKRNVKSNCYDTLFFTYEAEYKKKVHFAYLASTTYYCYAILCQEDEWLSSHRDEGHPLDIIELLDGEAIFMNWDEAVRDMCFKCKQYLPLYQVILSSTKAIRLSGDEILTRAKSTQTKLYRQATRLEELANKLSGEQGE